MKKQLLSHVKKRNNEKVKRMFVENTRYDSPALSPLDMYGEMFSEMSDSCPTLSEALLEMRYGDVDYAMRRSQENANAAKEYPNVEDLGLT